MLYIRETWTSLRTRFSEHRRPVKNDDVNQPIARYLLLGKMIAAKHMKCALSFSRRKVFARNIEFLFVLVVEFEDILDAHTDNVNSIYNWLSNLLNCSAPKICLSPYLKN